MYKSADDIEINMVELCGTIADSKSQLRNVRSQKFQFTRKKNISTAELRRSAKCQIRSLQKMFPSSVFLNKASIKFYSWPASEEPFVSFAISWKQSQAFVVTNFFTESAPT